MDLKPDLSRCPLEPSRPVVVGVSGGADSLCLLGLLQEGDCPVIVAHFNHQLRPEAEAEAEQVRAVAGKMGVPFLRGSEDVAAFAREQGFSMEEAARKRRYQFLFETARARKAQAVAVAHTADDQVETILMHLVRGTGLSGLKGMPPCTWLPEFDAGIPLLRPILHLWRSDTEAYCRAHGLDYVLDPSNTDEAYFRNRIRHRLIPELEAYNPLFKKAVLRMARSLQDDQESLNEWVETWWKETVEAKGEGYIAFKLPVLQGRPPGMRRNLIRRAMLQLRPGLRDVDFEVLERASASARERRGEAGISPGRRMDLTGGMYLYQEQDRLYIANYEADLPPGDWPQIEGERPIQAGVNDLGEGWSLLVDLVVAEDVFDQASSNADPFTAWMNAGKGSGRLSLRPMAPGDSFQPLGMNGQSAKLSDYFVNLKLPRRARSRWPLLLVDQEIAWVMGLRLSHAFRVEGAAREALRFQLKRLP